MNKNSNMSKPELKSYICKFGHITKAYDMPDVCRECKKEKPALWISSFKLIEKCFCGQDTKGHETILAACKKSIKNK